MFSLWGPGHFALRPLLPHPTNGAGTWPACMDGMPFALRQSVSDILWFYVSPTYNPASGAYFIFIIYSSIFKFCILMLPASHGLLMYILAGCSKSLSWAYLHQISYVFIWILILEHEDFDLWHRFLNIFSMAQMSWTYMLNLYPEAEAVYIYIYMY